MVLPHIPEPKIIGRQFRFEVQFDLDMLDGPVAALMKDTNNDAIFVILDSVNIMDELLYLGKGPILNNRSMQEIGRTVARKVCETNGFPYEAVIQFMYPICEQEEWIKLGFG